MSDDARLHWLRIRLHAAEAVYASTDTHDILKTALGDIWDRAIALYEGQKALAAQFLLTASPYFEQKRPMDVALSGEDGQKRVSTHLQCLDYRGHYSP